MTEESLLQRITALLEADGCRYEILEHDAVATAQEAAAARATDLAEGAKAILLKYDSAFGIFVVSAAQRIRSARIRRGLKVARTRFASREELAAMTGLEPGAVPPFGEPILPFPVFVDPSVTDNETMVFTAGSHTTSIRMKSADYRRIARPHVFRFIR